MKLIFAIAVSLALAFLTRPCHAQEVRQMIEASATTYSVANRSDAKLAETPSALKLPNALAIEVEAALMQQHRQDPLTNGMAIGALAGLFAGMAAVGVAADCFESGGCDGRAIALGAVTGAAIGAAVGAGFDALMNRHPSPSEDGQRVPRGLRRWRPLGLVR